ncbi:MAG: sugar-binding transcriptional regulator [Rhodobacteraceae bacterium]|nr:sugar-binding transcriptional regulator [Paracoccaceae bacterium]
MARTAQPQDKTARRRMAPPMQFGGDLVLWAAWLYYEEGLKQDEIALRLGISRASVFNLLQKARDEGVVTITIDPSRIARADLAMKLHELWGLAECYVLPNEGGDTPLHDRIGRLGARIVEQKIGDEDIIGVAWGRTVLSLSKALSPMQHPGVTVAQLTGSSMATHDFSPEFCTSNIASRLNARCVNLHAPGVLSNAAMKDLLMREPMIEQHFALLRRCTMTLFGVTHLDGPTLLQNSGFMQPSFIEEYRAAGAVGFASGYFFDIEGRIVTTDFDSRHVVMPLEDFRRVPRRICIGGGASKFEAIRGMLRARIATILITDQTTAEALV